MAYNWLGIKTIKYLLEKLKEIIPTKISDLENDQKIALIEDSYYSDSTVYSSSKTRSLLPIGLGSASQPVYFDWDGNAQCGYKDTTTALGLYANAGEYNSVAVGMSAATKADNAIAIGYMANASKDAAIGIGRNAQAKGTNSVAVGIDANAYEYGTCVGRNSEAQNGAVAIGVGAKAKSDTVAIGPFASTSKNQVFAVGINTDENAFDIRQGSVSDSVNLKLEPGSMYMLRITAYDKDGLFYGATSREFVTANGNAYWWKPCNELRASNAGSGGYGVTYPADSSVTITATQSYTVKYSLLKLG